MNDYKKIEKKLVKFVKSAYNEVKHLNKNVSFKNGKDLLTAVDLSVEKILIKKLNKFMPNVDIISEEYNFNKSKTKEYFAIDPIDGTINFASGLELFGIQVAYINDFEEKVAVLYFPKLGKLFTAIKGQGSFYNGKKISVGSMGIKEGIVAIDFAKANPNNYDIVKNISKHVMRVREFGAACYGFSMMASGNVNAYIIFQNTPWDIDPGYLLCKEAGAFVERNNKYIAVANSAELLNLLVNEIDSLLQDNIEKWYYKR